MVNVMIAIMSLSVNGTVGTVVDVLLRKASVTLAVVQILTTQTWAIVASLSH